MIIIRGDSCQFVAKLFLEISIIVPMLNFIKKYTPNLPTILLILMLVIPFLLYYFAQSGSKAGVMTSLVTMGAVMLVAMKK